eukprot:Skav235043  [mRNA]  locus=scaffold3324:77623:78288:+ [translate_table: standard]
MLVRTSHGLVGDPDDRIFIVIANLKWGLLVWPAVLLADGRFRLPSDGQLEWYFTTHVDQHEAAIASPILTDLGISLEVNHWEHSLKALLRNHSLELTFNDLAFVAETCFGVEGAKNWSRLNLVKELAARLGDSEFVELVMAKEETKRRKKKDNDHDEEEGYNTDDSLAELLLDHMDDEDDFKELKKRVNNRHQMNKKRKWAQWRKEANDETCCLPSNTCLL